MNRLLWLAALMVSVVLPTASRAAAIQTQIPNIWYAPGSGPASSNTFIVLTPGGPSVIIDTSGSVQAQLHRLWLQRIPGYVAPSYIILTHGHGDHTGGVAMWKGTGNAHVIAQKNQQDLLDYQYRMKGFLNYRNNASGGITAQPVPDPYPGNFGAPAFADIVFDQTYSFSLGGLTFVLTSTPGETPDMLNVWIPELGALFVGDNWYRSFPNLGSPRGTRPRWALEYVDSMNKALGFNAALMLPSHGDPVPGTGQVASALTNYRDAIQSVHDQVLTCLDAQFGAQNSCQSSNGPPTLEWMMQNIKPPKSFTLGDSYGRIGWGVRAIAQDYIGWFEIPDGSTCLQCVGDSLDLFPDSLAATLGTGKGDGFITQPMAATAVTQGQTLLTSGGSAVRAARLADLALRFDAAHKDGLNLKYCALGVLIGASTNGVEKGWLSYNQDAVVKKMGPQAPNCSFVPHK